MSDDTELWMKLEKGEYSMAVINGVLTITVVGDVKSPPIVTFGRSPETTVNAFEAASRVRAEVSLALMPESREWLMKLFEVVHDTTSVRRHTTIWPRPPWRAWHGGGRQNERSRTF